MDTAHVEPPRAEPRLALVRAAARVWPVRVCLREQGRRRVRSERASAASPPNVVATACAPTAGAPDAASPAALGWPLQLGACAGAWCTRPALPGARLGGELPAGALAASSPPTAPQTQPAAWCCTAAWPLPPPAAPAHLRPCGSAVARLGGRGTAGAGDVCAAGPRSQHRGTARRLAPQASSSSSRSAPACTSSRVRPGWRAGCLARAPAKSSAVTLCTRGGARRHERA